MNAISNFLDFMHNKGCAPASAADIKPTDKWTDYQIAGDSKGKKKGYYTLKIDGDYVSGACGDRRNGETYQFHGKPEKKLTDAERREYAKRREEDKKKSEAEEKRRHEKASEIAKERWAKAKPEAHPYLKKKSIAGDGSRVLDGMLLIPMRDTDKNLWGVQSIAEDGSKLFQSGGRKKGCYATIAPKGATIEKIYIAEGYATAHTVADATGCIALAAFDAGNLKPVAQAIRKKYPDAKIVIAADNDHGKEKNAGIESGEEAARIVGGVMVYPEGIDGSDWNDMQAEQGLDSVVAMIADRERVEQSSVVAESSPLPPNFDEGPPAYFNDIPLPEIVYHDTELDAVDDWQALVIHDAKGMPAKASLKNNILYLQHHPRYRGIFRYNEFSHEIMVVKCPPWGNAEKFKAHPLDDIDISQTASNLENLGMSPDRTRVHNAIEVVANKNKFHPARDYFERTEWDGVERLHRWLSYYLGAEDASYEYLSFVGRKWMTAAVKRVFEPGCKFDHVLVLEGEQGRGKSTALKVLATFGKDIEESYFTDSITIADIQQKDTIQKIQGSIIVELAELAGFNKKDDEEIKRWITLQQDDVRLPYARTTSRFMRQFVLSATVNTYDYLKDPTGNRRYWPVITGKIDIEALKEDRKQLWAEAYNLYKSGLYIGPTEEEAEMAKAEQEKRRTSDAWEEDVIRVLRDFAMRPEIKTEDIMKEIGLGLKDRDYKSQRRIASIMRAYGYDSMTKRVGAVTQRVWVKK